jgi:hypothetical protein
MAEIGLDGSGFERGLRKIGSDAAASVKNLAVQAFGIYAIEQAIAKTVETATDLVNESKRLSLTVEQLQLLRQAAKNGSVEMDTLATAFERLDVARARALGGDKLSMDAFAKLGITQPELKTQTSASLFMGKISEAAKTQNTENLAPVLREIFGRAFGQLLPVMKTDFGELGSDMHKFGAIMDAETAVKLKDLGNSFDLLKQILAVQLGPVLLTLVESIFTMIGKIKAMAAFWGTVVQHVVDLQPSQAKPEVLTSNGKINLWKEIWAELFDGGAAKPEIKNTAPAVAAQAAEDEWTKAIDGMRKKLQDEAKDISNPKPIVPEALTPPKAERAPADALVRVGNFLGNNGSTINRVDQRKIDLLQKIADNTKPQGTFGTGAHGTFGTGGGLNFFGIPLT